MLVVYRIDVFGYGCVVGAGCVVCGCAVDELCCCCDVDVVYDDELCASCDGHVVTC